MKYALIIGNDTYLYPGFPALAAPAKDVEELSDVLGDPAIGAFEVQQLINAPEDKVTRAIERFFRNRQRDDLLLLHFSGHGVLDINGRLHLAVTDTSFDELSSSSIPARFVSEQMDATKSSRVILMLDCCHSGSFVEGRRAVATPVGSRRAFEGTGYGRWVLTATDETQYAWEGESPTGVLQPSIFTRSIVEGLRTGKADVDRDGFISVRDLADYVSKSIATGDGRQTPCLWSYKEQDKVIIAENPAPQLPEELVAALINPFARVRLAAVRELGGLLRSAPNTRLAALARAQLSKVSSDDDSKLVALAASQEISLETEDPISLGAAAELTGLDQLRQTAGERAKLEEAPSLVFEQAHEEEASRLAAERIRQDEERVRQAAIEMAKLEQREREAAAEKSRLEEAERQQAAERARKEEASRLAAERIRQQEERERQAKIEMARLEQQEREAAEEKSRREEAELQRAAERAREEEASRLAAERIRQQEECERQAATEKASLEQREGEAAAEESRLKEAEQPQAAEQAPPSRLREGANVLLGWLSAKWKWALPGALIVVVLLLAVVTSISKNRMNSSRLNARAGSASSESSLSSGVSAEPSPNKPSVGSQSTTSPPVFKDQKLAGLYLKAIAGDAGAMLNLGIAYDEGEGVDRDYNQAVAWYRKAADAGVPEAMNDLGEMYYFGKGVKKNDPQAFDWYRKGAKAGNSKAMANLGYMYGSPSWRTEDDEEQAFIWLRKAADAGDADGMYYLGNLYYKSAFHGDVKQAVYWLGKAAQLGNQDAKDQLKRLGETPQ